MTTEEVAVFDACQKSTGTGYTTTVTFLVIAFIFSPVLLFASHPYGYLSISLAIAGSALFIELASIKWKRSSQLTMASIEIHDAGMR
jgi:hypothetical protein